MCSRGMVVMECSVNKEENQKGIHNKFKFNIFGFHSCQIWMMASNGYVHTYNFLCVSWRKHSERCCMNAVGSNCLWIHCLSISISFFYILYFLLPSNASMHLQFIRDKLSRSDCRLEIFVSPTFLLFYLKRSVL